MKLKLTNYDTSEYKQFEIMLNEQSKQGYNCKSVDMFTIFNADQKRYYYLTDIFVADKSNAKSARIQRDEWLLNYLDHGYEFIGKSRKIYVFKAKQLTKVPGTKPQLLLNYFKRNKTLSNIFFIFIAMLLTFALVPDVLVNKNPIQFFTNGSMILHYLPLLFCSALLIRFFNHYLTTEKIKLSLTKNQKPKSFSKYPFLITNWLLTFSVIAVIGGFILDFTSRKNIPLTPQIITLNDLGLKGNQEEYNTYISGHSLMIDEAISYYEDNHEDALKANYYRYDSLDKAKKALNNYLDATTFKQKKQITNGYLLGDDQYNCIAFVKDKQLIIVQTTIDLQIDNTYQKIISFNY